MGFAHPVEPTLVLNRVGPILPVAAAKAPGSGDRCKAMLEDIATAVDGRIVAPELGNKPENLTLDDLGGADRVVLDKDATTIIGDGAVLGIVRRNKAKFALHVDLGRHDEGCARFYRKRE